MSGMVDDVRKLLQDLVTPDLKSLQVQVAAIEKSIVSTLEKSVDARLKALESTISANKDVVLAQIKSLEGKVDSNHASVLHSLDLDKRLEQLERLQQAARGPANEVEVASYSRHRVGREVFVETSIAAEPAEETG